MFVPIVIDPCQFYDYRYLWVYLKFLYHAHENGWALITTCEYKEWRDKRPISNVYDERFTSAHQYTVLSVEEEKEVPVYYINNAVFNDEYVKTGSRIGTQIDLLKNRNRVLENELFRLTKEIKKNHGKIEGFITWNAHYKSIDYLAQKFNIPVITMEFGLRFPEYFPTCYFTQHRMYGDAISNDEIQVFRDAVNDGLIEVLTKKELLAIFLEQNRICLLENNYDSKYEMGIATVHPLVPSIFAESSYTDIELIQDVRNQYSEDDILLRNHPGDEPYQAKYTLKNIDNSDFSSDFICNCKRITAQGSNILLEALLLGRTVYSHDVSAFQLFMKSDLSDKELEEIDDVSLNYLLFVYLSPYDIAFDNKYINWRIHENSPDKIFNYHIKHYLTKRGIPEETLKVDKNYRLKALLNYRRLQK